LILNERVERGRNSKTRSVESDNCEENQRGKEEASQRRKVEHLERFGCGIARVVRVLRKGRVEEGTTVGWEEVAFRRRRNFKGKLRYSATLGRHQFSLLDENGKQGMRVVLEMKLHSNGRNAATAIRISVLRRRRSTYSP
jgi:hypothetical protein